VAAEREVGLDALLDDDRPQLLEARDLRLCERLVEEIRERGPPPQCKSLAERDLGGLRLAALERRPPLLRETRETMRVDPLRLELEDVSRHTCRDDGPERLAQLGDVDLDRVTRSVRRIPRPERLHEPIDGDDSSRLEREDAEERAGLLAPQRDRLTVSFDLDGAEETYFELWGACPGRSVHVVPR
jgi:hypothetical protein